MNKKHLLLSLLLPLVFLSACVFSKKNSNSYDEIEPGFLYSKSLSNMTKQFARAGLESGFEQIVFTDLPAEEGEKNYYALQVTNASPGSNNFNISLPGEEKDNEEPEPSFLKVLNNTGNKEAFKRLSQVISSDMPIRKCGLPNLEDIENLYVRANLRANKIPVPVYNHADEIEGEEYFVPVLGKSVKVTLAKVTENAKFFVDYNSYKGAGGELFVHNTDPVVLEALAKEFETYIYPFMTENYGKVHDVDKDGKLSILLSPYYSSLGYAGLFYYYDLLSAENPRDLIGIGTRIDRISLPIWLRDARETIVHEMQHAINYSSKLKVDASGKVLGARQEDLAIDEGLSVCAEGRYRQYRGQHDEYTVVYEAGTERARVDSIANDPRFANWISTGVLDLDLFYFSKKLADYGQKGLFYIYLYERFGKDFMKALTAASESGASKIEQLSGYTKDALFTDWNYALLVELTQGFAPEIKEAVQKGDLNGAVRYSYKENMRLPSYIHYIEMGILTDARNLGVNSNASFLCLVEQPPELASATSFYFSSKKPGLRVNIMRLTE
ncbi:MAG: hypothetical protein GX221_05500 [Candidatus Riflebacteria bacterium]|nr:hypothetical protein [Candidatus Riflebacteria bacterium]